MLRNQVIRSFYQLADIKELSRKLQLEEDERIAQQIANLSEKNVEDKVDDMEIARKIQLEFDENLAKEYPNYLFIECIIRI